MNKNKKTTYTDEPIQLGKVVKDFLPRPEEIAKAEMVAKVTIGLSDRSVKFFQKASRKYNIPYQRLIRKVLDAYVESNETEV